MSQNIIVVGGAGAIGQAYVHKAKQQGAHLAIMDLPRSLHSIDLDPDIISLPVDVGNAESVSEAFSSLQDIWSHANALIYLSGYAITPPRPAIEISEEEWLDVLNVNLTGAFRVAMSGNVLLQASPSASLVLMSSGMAYGPVKGFAPYIASKAGLIGLTRALALEMAPHVRVNAIAPSAIETPFLSGGTGAASPCTDADWFKPEHFISTIPMGRLATPADCVGAINYLVSPESEFMNGQVLHINGGRQMR